LRRSLHDVNGAGTAWG